MGLNIVFKTARGLIDAYELRRLRSIRRSNIERKHTKASRTIRIREYDQTYGCFTLPELRWLFQTLPRWGPYYTYFLLAASTGIRGGELVKLTLANFDKDFTRISYQVLKPSQRTNEEDMLVEKHKWRTVELDEFVRQELLMYLKRHCVGVGSDGNYVYVTPWHYTGEDGEIINNKLFSFKDLQTVTAYWHKLKKRAKTEGYDVDRLERQTTNHFTGSETNTYVWRMHMFRHLSTVLYYYKHSMDMIDTMNWINHNDPEVTTRYLHSASEVASTPEELRKIKWTDITGHQMEIEQSEEVLYA